MIVIWPGHVGKPETDPGACGPSACEADVTGQLAAALCAALREVGLAVADLGAGTYADRAEYADDIGARLVLHLHLDVGRPAVYHWGSLTGERWARAIQAAVAPHVALELREATASGYPRARGLLALTRAPAVLLELADVRDEAAVAQLRERAEQLATALAAAIRSAR